MVVRLDQKRLKLQYIHQQLPRRVHDIQHTSPLQPPQNIAVDRIRQAPGNAARKNKDIARPETVQFPVQLIHMYLADFRSHAVDLCAIVVLQLDIDA